MRQLCTDCARHAAGCPAHLGCHRGITGETLDFFLVVVGHGEATNVLPARGGRFARAAGAAAGAAALGGADVGVVGCVVHVAVGGVVVVSGVVVVGGVVTVGGVVVVGGVVGRRTRGGVVLVLRGGGNSSP